MLPELVLASTSPFRKSLMQASGLRFRAVAPQVEEVVPEGFPPSRLAAHFARLKAREVADRLPESWVIGSDQTIELEGRLFRKPTTRQQARKQLAELAGATHHLRTAIALVCRAHPYQSVRTVTVAMTMRSLTRRELEAYLDTHEWEGCAGGYRLEGQGVRLFEAIRGDFQAVIGLPMVPLIRMLNRAGIALF